MKILYVVHQFLPLHVAGTEIYAYHLAKEMRRRGQDARVFYVEWREGKPPYHLEERTYREIPCFEAVPGDWAKDFRGTYMNPGMEKLFREVLDRFPPDLVHIQHLANHSIGYLDILEELGIPSVYTLHEYLLMCPGGGRLLRPGLELCPGPEPAACAACAKAAGLPPPAGGDWEKAVERRKEEIVQRLAKVNLFLSPSRYLRKRFVEAGWIPSSRILASDNGFPAEIFHKARRRKREVFHLGYIGTMVAHKGVHVLVEACRGLPEKEFLCSIHGDLNVVPEYGQRLRKMDKSPCVRLMGAYDHQRVGEILADLDVAVVPSLWVENSPLTIHEAFLAGVPLLVSDIGGMAELVPPGRGGLQFKTGDPEDLREKILLLHKDRKLLQRLRETIPQVKTIQQDARDMEDRYRSLLDPR